LRLRLSSGVRSIAGNTAALVMARAIAILARLAYVIIIGRVLGPEIYGLVAYGQSWYVFFYTLSLLGLGARLATGIGESRESAPQAIAETATLRVAAGVVCLLLANGVAAAVEPDADVRLILFWFSLAMVGRIAATHWAQIYTAFERSTLTLRQETIFAPLEAALGIALVLSGQGIVALALLHTAVWMAQAVYGYTIARRLAPIRLARPDAHMFATLRRFAPLGLDAVLIAWISQGPIVLARSLLPGFTAVGQVGVLIHISRVLNIAPSALAQSAVPILRRTIARGEDRDALYAGMICRVLPPAAGLVYIVVDLLGPPAILAAFGPAFEDAARHAAVIPILWLPSALAIAIRPVLISHFRIWSAVVTSAIGAFTLLAGILLLGEPFGIPGLLAAAAVAYGVWFAAVAWALHRKLGLRVISGPALWLFAGAVGLTMGMDQLVPEHWLWRTVCAAAVACGVLAASWFAVLRPENRHRVDLRRPK